MRLTLSAVCLGSWIAGVLLLAGCGPEPPLRIAGPAPDTAPKASTIAVAAASDLKFALDEAIAEFGRRHPAIEIRPAYGSSGLLFAQLSNRAPFDMFLSADIEFPRKLIERNRALADSEFQYAVGHLVVWVRDESTLDVETRGMQVLTDPAVRNIAIANPKTAPYGRAAEAAIRHFGLDEALRDRLVLGENISQTAQFVESGAADVGIIALSLALAPAMKDKGRYWPVPLDSHPPLLQGGVILKGANDPAGCEQFRSFLISEAGRAILRNYGFQGPGE